MKGAYYFHHMHLSVCPSACMYQDRSYRTDFREIWYWGISWKLAEKFRIWL